MITSQEKLTKLIQIQLPEEVFALVYEAMGASKRFHRSKFIIEALADYSKRIIKKHSPRKPHKALGDTNDSNKP